MSRDWRQPIARIWSVGGIVGTGCLVQTPQEGICLLTAAHVVNQALSKAGAERGSYFQAPPSPEELLVFDLPFRGGLARYAARVIQWHPARPPGRSGDGSVEDIALLKVLSVDQAGDHARLPQDLHVFALEEFEVLDPEVLQRQSQVRAYGFSRIDGAFARGSLHGPDAVGRLHLVGTAVQGDFVSPGFSGAPVFMGRRIIGMAVSVDGNEDIRLAFLQSTFNLWRACPELARPYRGLRAFEEEDAPFFFGRDAFIDQVLAKAKAFPVLGVTAASGSGKSSAIRAGLIPKLRVEGQALILLMRPASDPWKELALELCRLDDPTGQVLDLVDHANKRAQTLRSEPGILTDYAAQLLDKAVANRLVIVVDQFEELFTLAGHDRQPMAGDKDTDAPSSADGPARRLADFRDLMVASANLDARHGPVIQWLFALRGDFADRAFRHRPFADRVGDGNMFLADMTNEELHGAVREPATQLGVSFDGGTEREPGLAERIARDGGHTAGTLPLVQHLLEELWRGMKGRLLTHKAYEGLGKVEGALERHAERLYGALAPRQKELLPRLFSRLVNVKEDGEATRRIARRSELGEERWALAERLAEEDARLLLLSAGDDMHKDAPDPTAEVGHEALLRHWSRLRDWVRADQRFLLWRQGFEQRLKDHLIATDKAGTWLSGAPLERALDYYEEREEEFSDEEMGFIKGSQTQRDTEDIIRKRQRRNLRIALFVAVISIILLTLIIVIISYILWVLAVGIEKNGIPGL